MNLATNLARSAQIHADRVAVRLGDQGTTYRELDERSRRVAGLLAERGVRAGDRVGIMLPNIPDFAAVYYGVLRAGAVVVPMNPLLKAREVTHYLADSGATVIFTGAMSTAEVLAGAATVDAQVVVVDVAFTEMLSTATPVDGVVDRDGSDTAVILYTSGTTGTPKGAELTHDNLIRNAEVVAERLFQLTANDVIFGGLPLFHSFGQTCTLNTAIAAGACLVLLPRFDPALALTIMATRRATVFAAVPTMYGALLAVPDRERYDVSALRVCLSGGAALPVEVLSLDPWTNDLVARRGNYESAL